MILNPLGEELTKDAPTTKFTKVTKDSFLYTFDLRALRVFRGDICFSCFVAASPRWAFRGDPDLGFFDHFQ